MNRIDFHSIATILLGGLIDADYSQMDFIYMLFGSFANDNVDFAFDNGLVCKWIKGQSRISPKIISYGWIWCRLKSLADPHENSFVDGPFGSNLKTDHYTDRREVRIIQLNNIGEFTWKNNGIKYTTYSHAETLSRYMRVVSMLSCPIKSASNAISLYFSRKFLAYL